MASTIKALDYIKVYEHKFVYEAQRMGCLFLGCVVSLQGRAGALQGCPAKALNLGQFHLS